MRLVIISDTHSMHAKIAGGVPDGDVLIHGGDHCGQNSKVSVGAFLEWFASQPHEHKIFIAGNHDGAFEVDLPWCQQAIQAIDPNLIYLQDSGHEIDGVKFWGAPWQPEFCDWHFNLPRGPALAKKWARIPTDTDVLITHGPPHGILDTCPHWPPNGTNVHVGCEELAKTIPRVQPKVHIFGHIHEGYGTHEQNGITFINGSNVDGTYRPVNPAIVLDI